MTTPSVSEFLQVFMSRSSVRPKRLGAPAPSPEEIELMAAAALRAPDHRAIRPWRFILISDDSRERLADIFVEAMKLRVPETIEEDFDRERSKALRGGALVVACAALEPDHPEVPIDEQLIAVGAGIGNFLTAAHAMGYGAILLSGRKVLDPTIRQALGVGGDEKIIGFINVGTVKGEPTEKPRSAPDGFLRRW